MNLDLDLDAPEYWRYCRWPDCESRYHSVTFNGLKEERFFTHRGGIKLCGTHHDMDHHPNWKQSYNRHWSLCSCGWISPEPGQSLGHLIALWQDHVSHI